ncbi:hypothetical protein ACFYTQ_26430 [Nocardia sp. NPDC004068]|uniref:hypothetical protein n=1 Tax=Nocardia sp. NPDC004068 TaxID=3364303 RepID=UPI0036B9FE5E
MTDNHLGEFLRARRATVRPEQIGLVSHGHRRVAGLRREEVAEAAGVTCRLRTPPWSPAFSPLSGCA